MSQPESIVAATRLRGLNPIDKLTQSSYRDLLAQTAFRKVAPGGRVFGQGEKDDWSVFLIEGALELHRGTDRRTVPSGTNETQGALGSERPRGSKARAISECTIARVPTSLLDMLARETRGAAPVIEVDELDEQQESVEDQLLVQLYEAYASDTMDVPSLPDVATAYSSCSRGPQC
jgi:CRP-like cAMP-binding protein